MSIFLGSNYEEKGYTAEDEIDGVLTDKVVVSGTVDYSSIGDYKITYFVEDSAGNSAKKTRTIHVIKELSSNAKILEFVFDGITPTVTGIVNTDNHTILVNVTNGTDVTSLLPSITISDNASISPASGLAQDFTSPITYTVTAKDGTKQG